METNQIKTYRDLRIWQKGISIVDDIYRTTDIFPKNEFYNLTSQIRRSAVSIPSNIAEGFARNHPKEYKQFLYIALGSCAELDTQLTIAQRRAYLSEDNFNVLTDSIDFECRMIMSLIKKLRNRQRPTADD